MDRSINCNKITVASISLEQHSTGVVITEKHFASHSHKGEEREIENMVLVEGRVNSPNYTPLQQIFVPLFLFFSHDLCLLAMSPAYIA